MSADGSDDSRGRLLRAYLDEFRETCPSCGYELHRLTGRRCPECGQALVLRVGLESPNLASFIAGLVGLAAGGGFAGLLLLYVVIVLMMRGGWGPDALDIVTLLGEVIVSGVMIVLWSRASGWIRRRPPKVRWLMVFGCWVYAVVCLILFTVVID